MPKKIRDPAILNPATATAERINEVRRQDAFLKTGALQNAIFNSANFSSIATDEKGVIQIFNVGAERMLGYTAADVLNKITPADISDPQELIARAEHLACLELARRTRYDQKLRTDGLRSGHAHSCGLVALDRLRHTARGNQLAKKCRRFGYSSWTAGKHPGQQRFRHVRLGRTLSAARRSTSSLCLHSLCPRCRSPSREP